MRDEIFWSVIKDLESAKTGGAKYPLSAERLEILFDTIQDVFGEWEAGNFAKLCTHINNPTQRNVARALLDLKTHHWIYEDAAKGVADKVTADAMSADIKSFLSRHFSCLTEQQRNYLPDLRPGKFTAPVLQLS